MAMLRDIRPSCRRLRPRDAPSPVRVREPYAWRRAQAVRRSGYMAPALACRIELGCLVGSTPAGQTLGNTRA